MKKKKKWTAARFALLAVGLGASGAGAYMMATGKVIPRPGGASCNVLTGGGYYTCVGDTMWDSRKRSGLVLTIAGAPLLILSLAY